MSVTSTIWYLGFHYVEGEYYKTARISLYMKVDKGETDGENYICRGLSSRSLGFLFRIGFDVQISKIFILNLALSCRIRILQI